MTKIFKMSNCFLRKNQLLILIIFILSILFLLPKFSSAHQAPYSIVYLDVSPDRVGAELRIPLSELQLAMEKNLSFQPETLIEKDGDALKAYILSHTRAYSDKQYQWLPEIKEISVEAEQQIASGPPFWELRVKLIFSTIHHGSTRKFMLDYDAVVHQVINHVVFVVIRSDWETGRSDSLTADSNPMTIRIGSDNKVHPLEIDLNNGTMWTGFKNMLSLGMNHIREGTDHLLFLITLLLPAMLLTDKKKWGAFGGVKYSFGRLLKIVTAFTIGHSFTLLISALAWIKLPSQPVEILIAFSILVSAIHAIKPVFPGKEIFIAGGFGLIHGLAFASAISNMNLNPGLLVLSILWFNLGIEFMQLIVIALIIPSLILLSKTPFYKAFRITAAAFAGIAAMAWISERTFGNENFITAIIAKIPEYGLWCICAVAAVSIIGYSVSRLNGKKYIFSS
ncbi:MAG TPA: HupE/UreJ family protein [Puia sp.]|nr:HupE/UreJ family protein [Puia sp.]